MIRDVIIIGAGPAGYAAGVYLARANLKPLILAGEKAGGQLMLTTEVENYPGFSLGIQGPDLMGQMRAQAEKFGAEVTDKNVTKVDLKGEIKKIWVAEDEYQAKAVIVSTGAKARMLGVGEEKFLGRGVSSCAVCDASFFRDKITYVVGGGDAAMEEVLALLKFAKSVMLIHRGDKLRASKIMQKRVIEERGVPVIWNSEVVGVVGKEKLEGIRVKNNQTGETQEMPAEGLFLAIGYLPATELFKSQLELDEKGYLKIEMTGLGLTVPHLNSRLRRQIPMRDLTQTSAMGVFGAGDVADVRYRQAITAAGMGCMAALDAEKFLTGVVSGY